MGITCFQAHFLSFMGALSAALGERMRKMRASVGAYGACVDRCVERLRVYARARMKTGAKGVAPV